MGAPAGNHFWELRSTHGRKTLFESPELMWDAACEYFEWCVKHPLKEKDFRGGMAKRVTLDKMRPFTMEGLCSYLDCNTQYFNQFEKALKDREDDLSKDFSWIVTRIKETVFNQQFTGAASGFLNPNIIARRNGLADKQEARQVDKEGNDVPVPRAPTIQVFNSGPPLGEAEDEPS